MTGRDATTSFSIALVDEWARAGVTEAVISPGSRSAPLALALARDARVRVHVVLDERSAAFRALGFGLASGRPAVVLCTSGTAAANFHPAVVEAAYARVPLLVCTADRPPELRETGAGQAIRQTHLYGDAVRWFCDPGPPTDEPNAGITWRALATSHGCRVARRAGRSGASQPSVPGAAAPDRRRVGGRARPRRRSSVDALGGRNARAGRRRCRSARRTGARASAGARGRGLGRGRATGRPRPALPPPPVGRCLPTRSRISARDRTPSPRTRRCCARRDFADSHRPDLVVRVGAPLTSKVATAWLDPSIQQVLVDPDGMWLDPHRAAAERYAVDADALLAAVADALTPSAPTAAWLTDWIECELVARVAIDATLDAAGATCEGEVAREIAAALPEGTTLVVASSVPVRTLEWCVAPRSGLRVLANRGANGIDGFVSTVVGVAQASAPAPTVGLCGDLCFLHDGNGLLGVTAPMTLIVLDNDGGGIFSYLPPAQLPEFEQLFGTPHGLDLVEVARAHGVQAERIDDVHKLSEALTPGELAASAGVRVLVVPIDRHASVARHQALWTAVAAAFDARG